MPRARWRKACGWPSWTSPSAPPCWKRAFCGATRAVRRPAQEILERSRHRQWPRFRRSQAGRAQERHSARAKAAIWSSPTSREGKGGLRDLQTLYWIGKYLYHVDDAADLVDYGVFTREEYRTFQKAEAFCGTCGASALPDEPAEERLSFDVQPSLAAQLGYVDAEKPRRAVEAFMRAYFLVAKDVGDLTRIFCAALEEQHRKVRPVAQRMLPGF
jgi:[protein-PII] uridylyltransferase